MKRIISIIFLMLIIFVDCMSETSYKVYNGTAFELNVCCYYFDGEKGHDFVIFGDMPPKVVSERILTNKQEIRISLRIDGKTCIIAEPYPIKKGHTNKLSIYNTTQIQCGYMSEFETIEEKINKSSQ